MTKRRLLIAGAILGVLTWVYDHDFFLNAGGAETPISRWIATHAQEAGPLVLIFWPLLSLTAVGLALGFAASKLLARSRPGQYQVSVPPVRYPKQLTARVRCGLIIGLVRIATVDMTLG